VHGIGADFPIEVFVGARLMGIRPLTGIIYFDFERNVSATHPEWPAAFGLGVESTWRLYANDEGPFVSADGDDGIAVAAAHQLTGEVVRDATVLSWRAFQLRFAGGARLEVLDDSDEYETFCIPELFIYI
jgi:hypothetical protein